MPRGRGDARQVGEKTAVGARVPAAVRRQRQRDTLLRTFAERVERDCDAIEAFIAKQYWPELRTRLSDLRRDARFLADDAERVGRKR